MIVADYELAHPKGNYAQSALLETKTLTSVSRLLGMQTADQKSRVALKHIKTANATFGPT